MITSMDLPANREAFDEFLRQNPGIKEERGYIAAWFGFAWGMAHAHGKHEPLAWMMPQHVAEYISGNAVGIAWAHHRQTDAYSTPLYAAPPAESEELARLRGALIPFADVANLLDAETEGVSDTDDMDLMLGDYVAYRFPVSAFKDARAALAVSPAPVAISKAPVTSIERMQPDPDATWNEAIEAAAGQVQRRIDSYIRDHSDCDRDPETGLCEIAPNVAEEIEASEEDIRAIRALKRQQGGNEA